MGLSLHWRPGGRLIVWVGAGSAKVHRLHTHPMQMSPTGCPFVAGPWTGAIVLCGFQLCDKIYKNHPRLWCIGLQMLFFLPGEGTDWNRELTLIIEPSRSVAASLHGKHLSVIIRQCCALLNRWGMQWISSGGFQGLSKVADWLNYLHFSLMHMRAHTHSHTHNLIITQLPKWRRNQLCQSQSLRILSLRIWRKLYEDPLSNTSTVDLWISVNINEV